jgi:hypothetical protein
VGAEQRGPKFESGPLKAGAILIGAGAAIGLIGLAVSGGHVLAATRRWIDEMETPPSELARQKWAQGKAAAQAGASAWQAQNSNGAPAAPVTR